MKQEQTELAQQNPAYQYDDEIDLFELFGVIWAEKITVLLFTFSFLIVALAYTSSATTVYEVKISYIKNLFHIQNIQPLIDNSDVNLIFADIIAQGAEIKTKKKVYDSGNVILSTSNPQQFNDINELIARSNEKYTFNAIKKAKDELNYLANDLPASVIGTEAVAKSYLKNKNIILLLESSDNQVLTIGNAVISVKSPKTKLILAVSVVLGGMLGLFFIFLRRGIKNYKERQKNS